MAGCVPGSTEQVEEGEFLSNLLYQIMTPCKLMNHVRTDDTLGGYTDAWTEGATFDASITKDGSTEAVIAERQGVSEIYTVVTKRTFMLNYHDVIKRVSDGAIFRITSNAKDLEAHPASTVQIAMVTAERWELT